MSSSRENEVKETFKTAWGLELKTFYEPEDLAEWDGEHGQRGFSAAFDLPTQISLDSTVLWCAVRCSADPALRGLRLARAKRRTAEPKRRVTTWVVARHFFFLKDKQWLP